MNPEILPSLDYYEPRLSPELHTILDIRGAEQFRDAHPEFYGSDRNSDLLRGWIEARGACFSLRNLEIAYRELKKINALEERPAEPVPAPHVPTLEERGVTRITRSSRRAFAEPTAETRETFADKPHENDVARKKRDAKLREQATAERIANRKTQLVSRI